MEFIEGEKNFNKILCRLSAIMHQDDPRYLDLTFDRTPEQRKKYKEENEAATEAANTLAAAANEQDKPSSNVVEALDPEELDKEVESKIKEQNKEDEDMEEGIDTEAQEVVKRVKELLLVNNLKLPW